MKIAFLSSFFPYSGDIANGNTRLYRVLEKSNEIKAFNFSLLYPDLLFPGKEKFVSPNEVVDIVNSERLLNTANPASYYFTANAINLEQPDLLITRYWMPYLGAAIGGTAKLVSKKTKKIAIIDSMRTAGKQIFEEQTNSLFANSHNAFIVLNNQAREDLLSIKPDAYCVEHPLPLFATHPNKVEKNIACKILNIPTNKKTLLFFGTVRKYKGIDTALHAMSLLDDDYHLVIAGDSPSGFEYYKRKIKDLEIENKVSLIEHKLNENEIPYIFYSADVLLMPYEEEVKKDIISRVFSFELPVIATDVGNFREVFEEKKFGLIIEKTDTELLIDAIKKYYAEDLAKVFKENLNALRYSHSWESLATIIYDIYEQLLDKEDVNLY